MAIGDLLQIFHSLPTRPEEAALVPYSNADLDFEYLPVGGPAADRPASAPLGWSYLSTDTNELAVWDGDSWSSQTLQGASGAASSTATSRTFTSSCAVVWSGSLTPSFTTSLAGAVNGSVERIYFPAGSINSIALNATIDPTASLALAFDTNTSAYLLTMTHFNGAIVTTLRKLARTVFDDFAALMGGTPQVFIHADDVTLSGSNVATWPARGTQQAPTLTGTLARNLTGWAGGGAIAKQTVTLNGSSNGLIWSTGFGTYDATTAFTWIVAIKLAAGASSRYLMGVSKDADANEYRYLNLDSSDLARLISNRDGTTETDTGTAATEAAQIILGVSLDASGNLLIKQLTSTGETTLLSTTHTMTGTMAVNRLTIGYLLLSGTPSSYVAGELRFAAARTAALSSTALTAAMAFVRDSLGCPLP